MKIFDCFMFLLKNKNLDSILANEKVRDFPILEIYLKENEKIIDYDQVFERVSLKILYLLGRMFWGPIAQSFQREESQKRLQLKDIQEIQLL